MMLFRKANEEELKMISRRSRQVLLEATAGYLTGHKESNPLASPSLLSSDGYYLVTVIDGTLRGWVGIDKVYDYLHEEPVAFVTEIYILPAYRMKGLASLISRELMDHLKNEGHKRVQINVFNGNPSKKIAESLGFREVSTLMELRIEE